MADRPGLFVVRFRADPEDPQEFERWYEEEHIPERLACRGFVSARRFRGRDDDSRYLAIYELSDGGALDSPDYRALAENASERTQRHLAEFRDLEREVYTEIGTVRRAEHQTEETQR